MSEQEHLSSPTRDGATPSAVPSDELPSDDQAQMSLDGVTSQAEPISLNINEIMAMLPHRYPFLMIDRLTEIDLERGAVGEKNVTINEPYFTGHFPGHPVMPGVMIIEAMAQTAASFVVYKLGAEARGRLVYFMSIDRARFRVPVLPGDQLRLHVTIQRSRGSVWKFKGEARVEGEVVADAEFAAMIRGDD